MARTQVLTCDACGTFDPAAGVGRVVVQTPDGTLTADLCSLDRAQYLGKLREVSGVRWRTRVTGTGRRMQKVRIEDLPPEPPPARRAGSGAKVRSTRSRP